MAESLADYGLRKKVKESGQGQLKLVGIIGGGSMGREIIQIVSQRGINVVFIDLTQELIESILKDIDAALSEMINKWGLTQSEKRAIMSRIKGSTDYKEIKDCELVIESINVKQRGSSVEARKEVFRKIEEVVSPSAVIASNNSSLMISDLASSLKHCKDCGGRQGP